MRWLLVVSLSCGDTNGVAELAQILAQYGSRVHARANFFDHGASACIALRQLNGSSTTVSFVPGFKTMLWRTLSPRLTAPYDYIWLKDSDVVASQRLFRLDEVEHWMLTANATVAQPSILPLDSTVPWHGWWTPFRASFAGSCMVTTSPIVEQMSPIFLRESFDAFRSHLLTIPSVWLSTDFGLETFWCGLEWWSDALERERGSRCIVINHLSVVHTNTRTIVY